MTDIQIRDVHVDREAEMRLFQRMRDGDGSAHVLLIEAPEGMGKSALIHAFWLDSASHQRARVNLKGAALSVYEVLTSIARQLHPHGLEGFHREVERLLDESPVSVERAFLIASRMTIHAGSADQDRRRLQQQRLTNLLVGELERANPGFQPVVLLLDTYDEATEDVGRWVTNHLLSAVLPLRWLTLVVAGRSLPTPDYLDDWWVLHTLELLRLEHVRDYVRGVRLALSDEQIQLIYDLTDGRPLEVATQVGRLFAKSIQRRGGLDA